MLRPTLFFVTVTGIISAAQVFDTVYALTGGGPKAAPTWWPTGSTPKHSALPRWGGRR